MKPLHLGVVALSVLLGVSVAAQQEEKKDMTLVGHDDLQARGAYQPTVHKQGERWILYVGHDGGAAPNLLTGKPEKNGTSIVDVTDPKRPKYLTHIPGGEPGGAQMVRVCNGSDLPRADKSKVYMLRELPIAEGNTAQEIWDVTDPAKPSRLTVVVSGLRDGHKNWWECDSGIAYLVSGDPAWHTLRMLKIYDLSDPARPVFIRDFGLPGQQPGAGVTGQMAMGHFQDIHGPVSTGPSGNRVYIGYGFDGNGILQIVDREKLLNGPKEPTEANLLYPQVARLDLPAEAGAHSVFPLLGMQLPEFAKQGAQIGDFGTQKMNQSRKDFVAVMGEETGNECAHNRQMVRLLDITTESKPFGVSTWTVPEASGGFCGRGGRFGTHSPAESFTPIYYNRVLFIAHFNAGVRALDIRDPFSPKEIAYYIPAVTDRTRKLCAGTGANERCKVAISTDNVDVDDRGYIYIVDRNNTGLHILELSGPARRVANFP